MSRTQGLTAWQSSVRVPLASDNPNHHGFAPTPVAVLIQVPTARPTRPARRPSAMATARIRASGRLRPRRRLRREVRTAGCVLLALASLALAAVLMRGRPAPTGGASDHAPAEIASVRPPSVWLSIEAPGHDPEPSVVFPGYLLPDDGSGNEEPSDAGG